MNNTEEQGPQVNRGGAGTSLSYIWTHRYEWYGRQQRGAPAEVRGRTALYATPPPSLLKSYCESLTYFVKKNMFNN